MVTCLAEERGSRQWEEKGGGEEVMNERRMTIPVIYGFVFILVGQ